MKEIYVKLIPVKQEAQWFPGTSFHGLLSTLVRSSSAFVIDTAYTPDQTAVLLLYRCEKSLLDLCNNHLFLSVYKINL